MAIKNASFINRKSEAGSSNDLTVHDAIRAFEKYDSDPYKQRFVTQYGDNAFKEWAKVNKIDPAYNQYYSDYLKALEIEPTINRSALEHQHRMQQKADEKGLAKATQVKTSSNSNKPVEGIAPPNTNINSSNYEDQEQYEADLAAGKINAKGEPIKSASDGTTPMTATDAALDFVAQLLGGYNNNIGNFQTDYADKAWEMIESYYNENPLETDYGKAILDYYGVLGENSANAVNAATAGENAGNIDSYAAANAERQRLSRYGQAVQNIYGMSSERAKNVNDLLSNLGVNMNKLYQTQGQYGVGTAADYAGNLYNTDASSTAAYNELMAAIEGNKTYTYDLSDKGVSALLKKAYNDLNPIGSDSTEIDWTATDSDQWNDVIQNVLKAYPNSGLTEDYLRGMIANIMRGTQAETDTTGQTNTNTIDVSKLPAWLQSIVLATTK